MRFFLTSILFVTAGFLMTSVHAQEDFELQELRWVDEGYLDRHRERIREIVAMEFGSRLRQTEADVRLLDRILEEELVNRTEIETMQAMGVVLGDVFVNELGMQWRVYLDELGKTRAVCLPDTTHCLFPVTMISKRREVGADVDVAALYERGKELMDPFIPDLPYSAGNK